MTHAVRPDRAVAEPNVTARQISFRLFATCPSLNLKIKSRIVASLDEVVASARHQQHADHVTFRPSCFSRSTFAWRACLGSMPHSAGWEPSGVFWPAASHQMPSRFTNT